MDLLEYQDVTPVKLNEESPQLCQILYSDEYKQTMGILLALMEAEEYSERALQLTQKGIELLASHYTIWSYRFNIVQRLDVDLVSELNWCEEIALDNQKNYQIWNYRQLVIQLLCEADATKFDPHREYPIMEAMLEDDPKNHHVWSYRKWLVDTFQLHNDPKEIAFVDECLARDVRNNSAWTHRFFLFRHRGNVEDEIAYAKQAIELSPQNPLSWSYLEALYKAANKPLSELETFCQAFAGDGASQPVTSLFALEMMARIHRNTDAARADAIYQLLATKYDPIRKNYWEYLRSSLVIT